MFKYYMVLIGLFGKVFYKYCVNDKVLPYCVIYTCDGKNGHRISMQNVTQCI